MQKANSRILVVDDSAFMRKTLKEILVSNGFTQVYESKDGMEAIEAYKKHKPDLITMDLIMPGPDGLQTMKEILALDKEAKVIMVTTVGQDPVLEQASVLGAKDFVVKPFETSKIVQVLENALVS